MNDRPVTNKEYMEKKRREGNALFPVFLKLETLSVLIVGGGNVALEKLRAVISNSPATTVRLVATHISEIIRELADRMDNIKLFERDFSIHDLDGMDIAIIAVNDIPSCLLIRNAAKEAGILVNVADQPDLCDFYLGSIVNKGNLKIAISTNGKSPTIAKRLKEIMNQLIPEEMEGVLQNMHSIRTGLNVGFNEKVKQLNDLTKVLVAKQVTMDVPVQPQQKKWHQIVKWCLFGFICMILGHAILSVIPFERIMVNVKELPKFINTGSFLIMLITGFVAQMIDGSLGMGYGTISTTFLLAYGVNPAIVSSRVHTARVFSSGVSGYTHHRFGNINKKLFKTLVIPGIIGAFIGASLAFLGQQYTSWVRIPLSIYTLYLGYFIIRKAFKAKMNKDKVKNAGWLASVGGFMDAFAGGGWGTLVTSTLIAKRKSPRFVIGSVCLAEFFVVLVSSVTFFILLKSIPLIDVAGLILGGLVAAPIAARLVGKLPLKKMYMAVGLLVILTSTSTLWKSLMDVIH